MRDLIDQNHFRCQPLPDDLIDGDHVRGDLTADGVKTDRVMRQIHENSLSSMRRTVRLAQFQPKPLFLSAKIALQIIKTV